jgi:hypothetical protein
LLAKLLRYGKGKQAAHQRTKYCVADRLSLAPPYPPAFCFDEATHSPPTPCDTFPLKLEVGWRPIRIALDAAQRGPLRHRVNPPLLQRGRQIYNHTFWDPVDAHSTVSFPRPDNFTLTFQHSTFRSGRLHKHHVVRILSISTKQTHQQPPERQPPISEPLSKHITSASGEDSKLQ